MGRGQVGLDRPGRDGQAASLAADEQDDRTAHLPGVRGCCVDDEGIELKVINGKKLISKSLNVPGYQVSLKQAQSSEEDALTLSMSPVSGRAK